MAEAKSKPFLKMTTPERDEAIRALEGELSFDDTQPLSPKGQALWQRATASHPRTLAADDSAESQAMRLLAEAKKIAQAYYRLTGRPLGVTGEIAEFEAIRLLNLRPAVVRQAGYDAIAGTEPNTTRVQIKGRCLHGSATGRIGRIQLDKEWDAVMLVLLDENFDATEIYQAERSAVTEALTKPGSRSRNERGALAVTAFKSISHLVWRRSA